MASRTDIQRKISELQETADDRLKIISELPVGPERELALLEYQCTAQVINAYGNDNPNDTHKQTVENLAILSYIHDAKKAGVTPSADDIRENGRALAENSKFSRVFTPREDINSTYVILNTLFDGPKAEHLTGWKNECTRETEDYADEFERYADRLPEEQRETVKDRFLRMGQINEYIKSFDYTQKKSPDELFAFASDPSVDENYRDAVSMQEFLNERHQQDLEFERIKPAIPYPVPMVKGIERSFQLYLDYSGTPEAAAANQKTVNRLHSDLPEDREFQRQYVLNMLNDMLSVPDSALYARSSKEADAFLKDHYRTAQMLWESPKFLSDVRNEYRIPDNVIEAVKHKSRLTQSYIISRTNQLKVETGAFHEEQKLLRSIDPDSVITVLGAENLLTVLDSDEEASEYTSLAYELMDAGVENDPDLEILGQYDGLQVKDSEFVQIGELPTADRTMVPKIPERPAEPNWAKRFLHVFGFFGDEFRKYRQDLEEYNDAVRLAESPNARRSSEWRAEQANRMYQDLDLHPENSIAAKEKERLDAARRNRIDMESTAVMQKIAPLIRHEQDIPFNNAVNDMIRRDGNDAIRAFLQNRMSTDMLSLARDRYKEGTDLEGIFRDAAAGRMDTLDAYLNGRSAEPEKSGSGHEPQPHTEEKHEEKSIGNL